MYRCRMAPNAALKDAIFRSGKSQSAIGQEAGISDSKLSRIVRGWEQASADERRRIAKALRLPIKQLFPSDELVERGAF